MTFQGFFAATFFSPADWVVIFVYLLGIVGLGIYFGKDQKNTRDYFLGSKNIPWWGIGLSIVAAETSALTIIGVPAMAYGGNMFFLQMIVGYVIARIILAVVMVPHYFKGEIYSPYQLLENSFGPGARRTASVFFLIMETLAAGVRVYVACIPVQLMLGIGVLPSIILFVTVSLVYTYIGGVKAVIWTDAVQFGLFLAGGLFTIYYIPTLIDGGFSGVMAEAAAAGKTKWLNWEFTWSDPINIWMGVIGGTFLVMSTHGAEQLIVQRVLACKNIRDGRRALILSAALIFPLFLIFLTVGVMLWVYYQHNQFGIPLPETKPGTGIKANDFIYPIFMVTAVPHILKGFLIVAILSAAMSSVSSAMTALASVSTMDIMKNLIKGQRDDAFFLRFSKLSTVFWAAMLIIVAFITRESSSVLNAAFALRGLTAGALLGSLMLTLFWRKASATPVVIGMFAALFVMTYIFLQTKIFWPWYTLIGTFVMLSTAYIARLFFKDKNEATPGN